MVSIGVEWVIFVPRDIWQCLEILLLVTAGGGVLMESLGYRPEMFNIQQCATKKCLSYTMNHVTVGNSAVESAKLQPHNKHP